ncbi:MAG: A/G-specific adenine glycosylase [Pirellulales bacterium]|nr:A/G-specific adenine glycosylase [Pirellulales bacterium]
MPEVSWRRGFRRRMLGWFARNAQDLPWRRNRDPYAVWLSEIMLQQTQVATVVDYFNRFIKVFPDVRRLAAAEEEQVLRLWEGLGYYRRARQLHQAAKIVADQYGGVFPRDAERLRSLPGVGRYTTGAILSIAFDRPEPILEANTVRVFSRLLGYSDDPHAAAGQALLWSMAQAILPRKQSGQLNQALMELGREVCKPRNPQCEVCPVLMLCRAFRENLQAIIPRPKRKQNIEAVREAAVVIRRRGRVLLRKRQEAERWSGLWDFPRFPLPEVPAEKINRAIADEVRRLTGIRITLGPKLTTLRHGVTRFRITLDCYAAKYLSSARTPSADRQQKWFRPEELQDIPLSRTGRKLAEQL